MENTGYKSFATLERYYTDNNTSTGETKPNVVSDPDYIAPFIDNISCPPGARYYNSRQTKSILKNDCLNGYSANPITLTAYPNQFVSNISVADANNQAMEWLDENAQIYANNLGVCITDNTPPSSPVLTASDITSKSIKLSWTSSTDNVGVIAYDIFINGNLHATALPDTLSYNVISLDSSTLYNFYVKARDTAGNSSNSNLISLTTAPITLRIPATKSVIFERSDQLWSSCKNANSAVSQYNSNRLIGSGINANATQYYLNRYRGLIDISTITSKPKSAKICFKFAENTVGNSLTINLLAANTQVELNQEFQLSDWNDFDSNNVLGSNIVPVNSTLYREIQLQASQLDLLTSQQVFNFFLISNGDKDDIAPSTNNRPTLSITAETGEIYLEYTL